MTADAAHQGDAIHFSIMKKPRMTSTRHRYLYKRLKVAH